MGHGHDDDGWRSVNTWTLSLSVSLLPTSLDSPSGGYRRAYDLLNSHRWTRTRQHRSRYARLAMAGRLKAGRRRPQWYRLLHVTRFSPGRSPMDLGAGLMIGRVREAWRERWKAGPEVCEKLRRQPEMRYSDSVCYLAHFCINLFSVTSQTVRKARKTRCIARKASGGIEVPCPLRAPSSHRCS